MPLDLHILPKVRDSISYLYVERCSVDKEAQAIAVHDATGKTPVPCAALTTLMLGPGTTITHAAVRTLTEHGCLIVWVGEQGVRSYAQGMGETRSSANLLRQSWLAADAERRLAIVRRMYETRFAEAVDPTLTLQQLRGREGVRVREAYAQASRDTGVPWHGRSYSRTDWGAADPVNRALSCANSCLYGICHAAIVSAGYSPALGFIHTGHMNSFVFDIADLYKADLTIPVAFRVAAESDRDVDSRTRHQCRDLFHARRLLAEIVGGIDRLLAVKGVPIHVPAADTDDPLLLWDPQLGSVEGGVNYADEPEGAEE